MAEKRGKDILITLSLFSAAFLIRAIGVPNTCMYPDEFDYYYLGNMILANNFTPTADVFKCVNPFLSYTGAVVTVFFGGDLNVLRMISVFFGSLTVPVLYLFGKAMYGRKTGLLAALFLCFSVYHCLFSRLLMLEVFTLFFITAFLYFFWLSQSSQKIKYACFAGMMMGLAFTAKYISFFLVPAVLAYVLWMKRFSFKALVDKRIVLIAVFALLFFSPLLISLYTTGVGLQPLQYQSAERFEKGASPGGTLPSATRVREMPLDELIVKAGIKIPEALSAGAPILIPLWKNLFLVATFLLFLITIFSFLLNFIKRESRGSFLIISLFIFFAFIFVGCAGSKYYLLYSTPIYFVMLSHLAVKSFEHLRKENSCKNIFRFFILLLTAIVLFSSFVTAVPSPYWDEGEYSWAKKAVDYIKTDAAKSGYEEQILIGKITQRNVVQHSIHLSDLNATSILAMTPANEYSGELATVGIEKIKMLKPHYLIVEELYSFFLGGEAAKEIFKDYSLVFHSQTYPYRCFVFKRKNMQPPELLSPTMNGKEGKISRDIFKRSVSSVMKVGKVDTVLVQVKNTGDSRTNFTAVVYSDQYTLHVNEMFRSATLDKGSIRMFKFKIVPVKEYVGELPITVDIYARSENETFMKVDSLSEYVYHIKR